MGATGQRLEIAIISTSTGLNVKATQQQEPPRHNAHSLDMRTFFSSTALAH